jgi:hypothetical protein
VTVTDGSGPPVEAADSVVGVTVKLHGAGSCVTLNG